MGENYNLDFSRGNNPYLGGLQPLFFMVLGSKGKADFRASFGSGSGKWDPQGVQNGLWDKAGSPSTVIS